MDSTVIFLSVAGLQMCNLRCPNVKFKMSMERHHINSPLAKKEKVLDHPSELGVRAPLVHTGTPYLATTRPNLLLITSIDRYLSVEDMYNFGSQLRFHSTKLRPVQGAMTHCNVVNLSWIVL